MEIAEKFLGRKLTPPEKYIMDKIYNPKIHTIELDERGQLILTTQEMRWE